MKKFIAIFLGAFAAATLAAYVAQAAIIPGGGGGSSGVSSVNSQIGGITIVGAGSTTVTTNGTTITVSSTGGAGGGGGGVASTSPFTIGQIVTVSSSGVLATNGFSTSDFLPSSTVVNTPSTTIIVPNGQTNFIPLWTAAAALGTSTMSVSGTTVMQNGVLQIAKLISPTGLSLAQAAGGTLATSSYFFEVTAVDVNNVETPVSAEVTTTTPANTSTLTVSWTHVPGVSFYKAYIATTTGAESLYATTTINSFAFSTTTINGAAGPKATSTPPSVNNTIFAQIGTATSSIGPIFGKCGLLINTTTPCNNQNTPVDATFGQGVIAVPGTLTMRAIGGGAPTLSSGSDLNITNSAGQKIAFTSGGTMVFSTAASTPGTYTYGLVTTTTNSMNMNGTANFNVVNATTSATLASTTITSGLTQSGGLVSLASTTINGQATTTNLSVTAVTSSPLAVNSSGLLERMTITTTTESNLVRYDSTTTVTVANNTSASTTFYTLSVPSGTLDNTGKQFIITAGGSFTYAGPSNTNLSLWLLYGGQTCISKSTAAITTSTAQGSWFATFHIGNASGSTSFQDCDIFSAEAGGSAGNIVSASSTAVDSTVTQSLVLKMQMNNANASNTIVANLVNVVLNYVTSTIMTGFSFN